MIRILAFLLALTCAASAQVPMTGAGLGTPNVAPPSASFMLVNTGSFMLVNTGSKLKVQ